MALKAVVRYPAEVLTKPCLDVMPEQLAGGYVRQLVRDMIDTMKMFKGCGLAANQIGEAVRVIVVEKESGSVLRFVNPIIEKVSGRVPGEEGCLSLPGVRGYVMRSERLTLSSMNERGDRFTTKITDRREARIIEHEMDHLNGVMFHTKMSVSDQTKYKLYIEGLERTEVRDGKM